MSSPIMHHALRSVLLGAFLSPVLWAHDDDPKALYRMPPYQGIGYRSAAPPIQDAGRVLPGPAGTIALGGGGATFPSSGVTLLSWLPLTELLSEAGETPQEANDCWGYTSPSGREYAIIGTYRGTVFVDVTNAGDAQVVFTKDGSPSTWRDIKVWQNYCYAVSEGGSGIQVFDLSQIDVSGPAYVGDVLDGGTLSTHNVVIDTDSGYLYRVGGGANHGLRIYDLNQNPTSPPFVGSWLTRYVHDAQVVTHDPGTPQERILAYCCSGFNTGGTETGFEVLDVTDPANIVELDRLFYPNPAYSHQGWLSPDRSIFYLGDELDESHLDVPSTWHMIGVSDPSHLQYLGSFTNGNDAITHNLYTKGDQLFAANYSSGLRVLDISNLTSPVETGFFDTWPLDDNKSFTGLWGCYPYFPSGVVIGSDRSRGLFVWWIGPPLVTFAYPAGTPALVDPDGETLTVQVSESTPGALNAATLELRVDTGAGFDTVPFTPLGSDLYQASFPPSPCGTAVAWYVTGESSNGISWNDPPQAPSVVYESLYTFGETPIVEDDCEVATGWVVGAPGDDADTGIWELADPIGTEAQPEDDHTPGGTLCWITQQTEPGGNLGTNDVDNGRTTLMTPALDLSGAVDPQISYWRWFSNDAGGNPSEDVFTVDVSDDDGSTWTNVEVVGPGGPQTSGGWFLHRFRVADLVSPTSTVRLRFVAEDAPGSGSIVEAAIDDLAVTELVCAGEPGSPYCFGVGCPCGNDDPAAGCVNSTGSGALLSGSGSTSVSADDLVLTATGCPPGNSGLFFGGSMQLAPAVFVGDGLGCAGGDSFRYLPGVVGADGTFTHGSLAGDAPPGFIAPGVTRHFQAWTRDVLCGPPPAPCPSPCGHNNNLSNAYSVTFEP